MNHRHEPPIDETEWAAQERGLRAARTGTHHAMDPSSESYRALADALASAPIAEPPAGFAASVAARIAHDDARFERGLSRVLAGLFITALVVVASIYGGECLDLLAGRWGSGATGLVMAGLSCLALTWTMARLWERTHPG